jgi:VanZ family protein
LLRLPLLLTGVRTFFWIALVFTFACAVVPAKHSVHFMPWDKANHFVAFYSLTILAAAAFPTRRLIWLAIGLSMFGAAIEIVQGLKFVARDRDFWDWVADTIAIAAAQGPILLANWRHSLNDRFAARQTS